MPIDRLILSFSDFDVGKPSVPVSRIHFTAFHWSSAGYPEVSPLLSLEPLSGRGVVWAALEFLRLQRRQQHCRCREYSPSRSCPSRCISRSMPRRGHDPRYGMIGRSTSPLDWIPMPTPPPPPERVARGTMLRGRRIGPMFRLRNPMRCGGRAPSGTASHALTLRRSTCRTWTAFAPHSFRAVQRPNLHLPLERQRKNRKEKKRKEKKWSDSSAQNE
jgi:hypothetical protein